MLSLMQFKIHSSLPDAAPSHRVFRTAPPSGGSASPALKGILFLFLFLLACSPIQIPSAVPTASTGLDADVEMEAAFQEARDTLEAFIERIATPDPNRTYVALKVRFSPPDGSSQDIWVDNVTYTDGAFRGSMGDDIPSLRLSFGEEIVIPPEAIVDWMIVEDGQLIGGYTIRLAYARMSSEEKERFLEAIDYSID